MSNDVEFKLDTESLQNALKGLNDKEMKKAVHTGLRKSGGIIVKEARAVLKEKVGRTVANRKHYHYKKSKNRIAYTTLSKDIRLKLHKKDDMVKINVMKSPLHWFQSGTQVRQTSKGYNRGKMEGKYIGFFSVAKSRKERAAMDTIEKNIIDAAYKIWNKK